MHRTVAYDAKELGPRFGGALLFVKSMVAMECVPLEWCGRIANSIVRDHRPERVTTDQKSS